MQKKIKSGMSHELSWCSGGWEGHNQDGLRRQEGKVMSKKWLLRGKVDNFKQAAIVGNKMKILEQSKSLGDKMARFMETTGQQVS